MQKEPFIYIVEDDADVGELEAYLLRKNGYRALLLNRASELKNAVKTEVPDLLLLDRMLPDSDGLEIIQEWRNDSLLRKIPIMLVTAKDKEAEIVLGLDEGADDYVVKPFHPSVLLSRVHALLRRNGSVEEKSNLYYQGLCVDCTSRTVTIEGRQLNLPGKEFELLTELLLEHGKVVKRVRLIELISGSAEVSSRTLDNYVNHLRRELASTPIRITTIWGIGYRME